MCGHFVLKLSNDHCCLWTTLFKVVIIEVDDKIWLVTFMGYDLGYFDEEENRVEPGAV